MLTQVICDHASIREPPGGRLGIEITAIRQEVAGDEGVEIVVVPHVYCGIPEQDERRHSCSTTATPSISTRGRQQEAASQHLQQE